jgi:hypothetical protein
MSSPITGSSPVNKVAIATLHKVSKADNITSSLTLTDFINRQEGIQIKHAQHRKEYNLKENI